MFLRLMVKGRIYFFSHRPSDGFYERTLRLRDRETRAVWMKVIGSIRMWAATSSRSDLRKC